MPNPHAGKEYTMITLRVVGLQANFGPCWMDSFCNLESVFQINVCGFSGGTLPLILVWSSQYSQSVPAVGRLFSSSISFIAVLNMMVLQVHISALSASTCVVLCLE